MATYAGEAKVNFTWARLFHLYGPFEAQERFVPGLLSALREGRRAELGPAAAMRDFMHVADCGRALTHLLAGEVHGAINVASGQPVTIGALAAIVARLAGRPDLLALNVRPSSEPPTITADVTRLRATGFKPSVALEDGLARLWSARGRQDLGSPQYPQRGMAPLLTVPRATVLGGVEGQSPRLAHSPADYDHAARLYRAGRMDEALTAAEAVLARDPNHAPALNLVGVLHRQRG